MEAWMRARFPAAFPEAEARGGKADLAQT